MSEVTRRDFLQFAGGIAVLLTAPPLFSQESGRASSRAVPQDLSAWLHIDQDGTITVYTGKVEVGQNIRTSLTQAVADELRVQMTSIRLVMGDTDLTPYDMGTFGSRTTPIMAPQLRRAAAAARELLKDLAAQEWGVDRGALALADGRVNHVQSDKSLTFGALTKGQKLVRTIRADVDITPREAWTVSGRSAPKVDGRDFVTGKHRYSSDLTRSGMLHGKIMRPPAFGSTLNTVVTSAAEKNPGVSVISEGDFVGVASASAPLAAKALSALKPAWKATPQPINSKNVFEEMKKLATSEVGARVEGAHVGSLADGIVEAKRKLERRYTVAYIAHVPLEPRAALAEWSNEKLTVWTGTQRPFGVRSELADAFRIPEERVRVIVPDTGSAYGGKHSGECAIEAARLAKAAGRPVRVVWTREEEMTWAYFRPAGVIEVRSGVDAEGRLLAWEFHNYNSGGAGIRTPYDVPNQNIEYHPCRGPLRQGSYRGLAATANHFAREVHMDELAAAMEIDPLEFRRRNLSDKRLRAVLDAAAERFGWGKTKAQGIACGVEKGGYTATCAEVRIDNGGVPRVTRLVSAFECGAVVNPDHLRSQIEGALAMGLGGALFEAINFEGGKILNNRLSTYPVPRFSDMPKMDVVLVDRRDLPSAGAGEAPIVGVAPAIAGAIFGATGTRLRSMPMRRQA